MATTPITKRRLSKIDRWIKGAAAARSRTTNSARHTTNAANNPSVAGLVQPKPAPRSTANTSEAKLAETASHPATSNFSRTTWWLWRIEKMPSKKATASTGSKAAKIIRQPKFSASQPPTEGPTAGAIALTSVPTPIIVPMHSRGACSVMMLNINGSAMPVPTPSSRRPTINIGKLWAVKPHTMPEI